MLLDEGAREWLALIEAKKKELNRLLPQLQAEVKRRQKLKSAKGQAACDAIIEELDSAKSCAEKYIQEETRLFFKNVFGILEFSPVAMETADGKQTRPLLATEMTARLLADGTGVFTVSGDSLEADVAKNLPRPDYLLVQESAGHKFVVLG